MLLNITFDDLWFLHSSGIRLHLALQGGGRDRNQGVYLWTQQPEGQVLVVLGAKVEHL